MVASGQRWALMHELRGAGEPPLDELLGRMSPVDLVLVEGFKHHDHPKIEVYRHALGKPLLHPDDPFVVAIASDEPRAEFSLPWLPLSDAAAIASFILGPGGRTRPMAQLSDDCFAFGGALLSVDDALARIEERVTAVVETETTPLARRLRPHSRSRSRCRDEPAAARQ